jgi:N4-gp56 family major capsid protein
VALPTAASVVSSGLSAYPSVYFDRVAVDTIQSNLALYNVLDQKILPEKSGVVIQIFDHSKMSANTTAVTEGTPPGSGQTVSQNTRQITATQYADYISLSDKVEKTMLIDQGAAASKLLAYRGALSVDNLIAAVLDTQANGSSAARQDEASGVFLTAAKVRKAVATLRSNDIKPKSNGLFMGVTHSLTAFDLVNDSSAGGLQDIWKYTNAMKADAQTGRPANHDGRPNPVATIGGCELFESNVVTSYASWASGSHTAYATYIVGADAVFGTSIGKTALGQNNFGVEYKKFPMGSNSLDPAGLIASAVVYNFFFGAAVRPGSINGFVRVRCESSLS